MSDPAALFALIAAGTAGLSVASAAGLKGWNGWLELKRLELTQPKRPEARRPSLCARIEMADMTERVRRLEAIASGAAY